MDLIASKGVCFDMPLRRTFLMGLGVSSLLAGTTSGISLGCQTNAWPVDPARFDSLLSVLEKIREIGFAGFETGFRNLQSQAKHLDSAREKIKSSGLQFFGVHIFLLQYDERIHIAPAELCESVARTGAALGAQWLILSGAPASTEDELARKVAGLHKAGVSARSFGLKLAYHNHDKEFKNSAWEIQRLLRFTDPDLVGCLLDAGHAFQGGADVASSIRRNDHPNRPNAMTCCFLCLERGSSTGEHYPPLIVSNINVLGLMAYNWAVFGCSPRARSQ